MPEGILSQQLGDTDVSRRARVEAKQESDRRRGGRQEGAGSSGRLDLNPTKPSSTGPLVVGWLLVLTLLGGFLAGAWFFRDQIVAAIPEIARLYEALGIEAEGGRNDGLEVQGVAFREATLAGEPTLVVTGAIFNSSTSTRPVPTVVAIVTDAEGKTLTEWRFRVAVLSLPPGGSEPFEARHPYPNHSGPISVTIELQPPKR